MGIYLNPGNENFKQTLAGRIYVDKSMMISEINEMMDTGDKYVCMSRPRRFGKTIASEMLSATIAGDEAVVERAHDVRWTSVLRGP